MTGMQAMTRSVNIVKLSRTEQEQERKMANTGCIDAFGIRFGASIMIVNEFTIMILGLSAFRHFERRLLQKPNTAAKLAVPLLRRVTGLWSTMAMLCYSQFVAVSRCSILIPAGPD